jgi:phage gpG-like protein
MATQMMSGISMGNKNFSVEFRPSPFMMAAGFDTLGANVKSYKEPLTRAIKKVMIPSIRKTFETEGRGDWTPLQQHTIENRQWEGYPAGPILQRSGALMRVAGQFNIWTVNGPAGEAYIASVPSKVWYGAIHQGGIGEDAFSAGSIVARPWAVMYPEDMADIEEIFFEWIEERVRLDVPSA